MIDAPCSAHGTRHRSGGVPHRCRATLSLTAAKAARGLPHSHRYPPESQRDADHRDRCHGASGAQQCSLLGFGWPPGEYRPISAWPPSMGTTITPVPLSGTAFDFAVDCRGASSLVRSRGDQNLEPYVTLADPTMVIILVAADYRSVPTAARLPWWHVGQSLAESEVATVTSHCAHPGTPSRSSRGSRQ